MAMLYTTAPVALTVRPQQPIRHLITKAVPDPPKKPRKVDEYVASSDIFRPGPGEYLVDCVICQQTFMNPELPQLKAHLNTSKHQRNCQMITVDGLTKGQHNRRHRLLVKYHFLEISDDQQNILNCTKCSGVQFDVTLEETAVLVGEHAVSDGHNAIKVEEAAPVLEEEHPEQVPEVESSKTSTAEVETVPVVLQRQHQAEVKRHPDVLAIRDGQHLTCLPCDRIFTCRPELLCSTVRNHLKSKTHRCRVTELATVTSRQREAAAAVVVTASNSTISAAYELLQSRDIATTTTSDTDIGSSPPPQVASKRRSTRQRTVTSLCTTRPSSSRSQRQPKAEALKRAKRKATIAKIVRLRDQLAQSMEMIHQVDGQLDRWLVELTAKDG